MEKPGWRLGCSLMIALALSLLLCGCECDGQGTLFEDAFENSVSGWGADQRDGFDRGYDGHYGVLCRYQDADGFYYFAVSADGYYAIFRRAEGDMRILTGDGSGMLPSPHIKTGTQVNRVLGVCDGDELSLYVNGQWLATVTDNEYARGDVGLGASSGPGGGTRIVFDNFVVTAP
jgi:hypothetical protein